MKNRSWTFVIWKDFGVIIWDQATIRWAEAQTVSWDLVKFSNQYQYQYQYWPQRKKLKPASNVSEALSGLIGLGWPLRQWLTQGNKVYNSFLCQEKNLVAKFLNTACKVKVLGKRCPEATRKIVSPSLRPWHAITFVAILKVYSIALFLCHLYSPVLSPSR